MMKLFVHFVSFVSMLAVSVEVQFFWGGGYNAQKNDVIIGPHKAIVNCYAFIFLVQFGFFFESLPCSIVPGRWVGGKPVRTVD